MREKPFAEDLARYKLKRAKEELETARLLCENVRWKAANNRAYYSIYYALTAVLSLETTAFKRHKDTLAYFNQHYVHTGKFSRELGRKIATAEKIRNASDYDDFYIANKDETQRQMETAEQVIREAENFMQGRAPQ
ncbi:MAG: HEPN domain-containing protein [Eubacteriales bacterium]|nr:HEPN domain-containing protein [Eubacteriales bacterium]